MESLLMRLLRTHRILEVCHASNVTGYVFSTVYTLFPIRYFSVGSMYCMRISELEAGFRVHVPGCLLNQVAWIALRYKKRFHVLDLVSLSLISAHVILDVL